MKIFNRIWTALFGPDMSLPADWAENETWAPRPYAPIGPPEGSTEPPEADTYFDGETWCNGNPEYHSRD